MINHDPHKNKMETTRFFNEIKIIEMVTITKINLIITQKNFFNQMMKKTTTKFINNFPQTKDLVLTVLINQIFSNHTHEINK